LLRQRINRYDLTPEENKAPLTQRSDQQFIPVSLSIFFYLSSAPVEAIGIDGSQNRGNRLIKGSSQQPAASSLQEQQQPFDRDL
jgi:hypothetical protein